MRRRKFNQNYQSYKTKEGEEKHIHSRVGEKKYHYEHIPKGFVIHHIDGDKNNNQRFNLILLHKKDHKRIHQTGSLIIKSVQPSKENEEPSE